MIFYLIKYYLESRVFALLPERTLKRIQIKRFRDLFEYTKHNSEFYRKVYSDAGILNLKIRTEEDLKKVPIVDKEMIMSHGIESVLTCPKSEKLVINSSSGSTGKPMDVYSTKKEHFSSYVRTFIALKGYNPFKPFVLIGLYKRKQKIENQSFLYYCQKYFRLFRREIYSVLTPFDEIKESLKGRNISILSSTPSCIKLLVDELKKSDEKLRVKFVVVSGETVFEDLRNDIKNYLGAQIINVYGSTELLTTAWTTPDGESFRFASNSVFVEYINLVQINGDLYGELVLTNLVNKTMPFVRYKIGDHTKIPDTTKKMGKVIGRIEDIIELSNGKMLNRLQICSIYSELSECSQYKFIQKKDKRIFFQATCKPEEDEQRVKEKILQIWRKNFDDYPLEVEFLQELLLNPETGKFKRIEVEL